MSITTGAQAMAAVSTKDMNVAVRTFPFFSNLASSNQDVMVIYDPGNAASKADAEAAMNAISALSTPKMALHPVLTPVGAIHAAKLAYVSEGLGAQYSAIAAASASKGILTFTKDMACVEAKQCVMYINAHPAVEIKISQSALTAANLEMAAALKMMVKEVQ